MKQATCSQILSILCCFYVFGVQGTKLQQSEYSTASLSRISRKNDNSLNLQTTDLLQSILSSRILLRHHRNLLQIRGGSSEDEEEEEYDSEYEDEEEDEGSNDDDEESTGVDVSPIVDQVASVSKKVVVLLGRVVIQTTKAIQRGIQAGLKGDEEDENDDDIPTPIPVKILKTIKRMVKAALTFPSSDDDARDDDGSEEVAADSIAKATKNKSKKASSSRSIGSKEDEEATTAASSSSSKTDFGTFLATTYGASDERDDDGPMMLGGNLANALKVARSEARMLVVFIPAARPSKKSKKSKDQLAIESVLSGDVAKAASKRSVKKGGNNKAGSFLLWGAKAGSSEATAAIKRLNVKTTSTSGDKRPILAVVYPGQVIDGSGIRAVPQLLAQHHCSPPPTSTLMAAWLDSLRKRYSKQYRIMQTELKEKEFYKERTEGYKESMQNDAEREEREQIEAAQKAAEEKAEKERQQAIEKRRKELKALLPDEPSAGGDAKRVQVRFVDGRSGQRRFSPDESISTVFNWVDAMFDMEREKVTLTTMNGKDKFTWDEETNDKSLSDLGLGKMVGFRVSEIKKEEDENGTDEESSEDSDEEDE